MRRCFFHVQITLNQTREGGREERRRNSGDRKEIELLGRAGEVVLLEVVVLMQQGLVQQALLVKLRLHEELPLLAQQALVEVIVLVGAAVLEATFLSLYICFSTK